MSEKELEGIGSSFWERGDGLHRFGVSPNLTHDSLRMSGRFDQMFRGVYSAACLMAYPKKTREKGWKAHVNDG